MPGSAVPCGNGGGWGGVGGGGCFCLWHPSAQLSRSFLHTHRLWERPTSERKACTCVQLLRQQGTVCRSRRAHEQNTLQNAATRVVTEPKDNENVPLLCIWKMCSSFLTSEVKLLSQANYSPAQPPKNETKPRFSNIVSCISLLSDHLEFFYFRSLFYQRGSLLTITPDFLNLSVSKSWTQLSPKSHTSITVPDFNTLIVWCTSFDVDSVVPPFILPFSTSQKMYVVLFATSSFAVTILKATWNRC